MKLLNFTRAVILTASIALLLAAPAQTQDIALIEPIEKGDVLPLKPIQKVAEEQVAVNTDENYLVVEAVEALPCIQLCPTNFENILPTSNSTNQLTFGLLSILLLGIVFAALTAKSGRTA